MYTLVYIGIGIAVGLGTLVILLFTVVPFVAIGFINWVVAILIGIPIVLLILLVLEGFSGSAGRVGGQSNAASSSACASSMMWMKCQ